MTNVPVRDGKRMVQQMDPVLTGGVYAFVSAVEDPDIKALAAAHGSFREAEGLSLIVDAALAPDALPMRQITLRVHSALDGVGLTAAVSGALADAGIPANVVAATHHDHVFVPADRAADALTILTALSADAHTI